jgi:hypothetical protein
MSKNLERVIQRAISDAAFRRQLQSNPEAALRGFKLTDSEVAALRSGDANKLTSLGIDQRMSKTFSFGGESVASRASIGGDLTSGAGTASMDGGSTSGATRLVINDSAGGNTPAFDPGIAGDNTSVGDPLLGTSGSSVIADPDNPASARTYTGGQSAPTSDAMEDQSHTFAASRSADLAASAPRSIIGDPDNPLNARGYTGEQGGSAATASTIGDPDNPASARTFTGGEAASTSDALEDQSHSIASRVEFGGSTVGYGAGYPEHGGLAGQSADAASSARGSIIGDPDNPANARGFIGEQSGSAATASTIGDPDNPASARTFTGGEAASTSDAMEDQSHTFAATRSADVAASGQAAPIAGSPEEFAFRDQGASGVSASNIGDPDNPASARTFTGGEAASTSDAMEDQGHAFAATRSADVAASGQAAPIAGTPEEFAFRDQGASGVSASNIGDPDNPASARTFTGGESAPTSDALEDQSHAIASSRSDAFLTEGEVTQYSTDPNWSSDQAEDASHAFNPDSATLPDDGGTATQHHEPDVPS